MKEIIHIKEPFYTAGRLYNWLGKPIGLGIDLRKLDGEGNIYVRIGENEKIWIVNKQIAKKFIDKYQSYYNARGLRLGVIAWYLFESEETIKEYQETLF